MAIRMSGSSAAPGVGPELGVTGSVPIKLSKFNSTDATSRFYNIATNEVYNRVNGNQVGVGKAPSPAASGSGNLSDWGDSNFNQYDQWDNLIDTGSRLNILNNSGFSAANCKNTASFSWTSPYYASNFAAAYVEQAIFIKKCAGTECTSDPGSLNCKNECDDGNNNPFDNGSPEQYTDNLTYSAQTSGGADLVDNAYYTIGIEWHWADQTSSGPGGVAFRHESEIRSTSSFECTTNCGTPIERTAGGGYGIIWKFAVASPSCTSSLQRSSSDTGDYCSACNGPANVARYHDGGAPSAGFVNGVTWYFAEDGTCNKYCDNATKLGSGFIVDTSPETAYTMSNGVIDDTNPGDCSLCSA